MLPKINKDDLDIIYGMIIGDGTLNIQRIRGKNARLSIFHCPKQSEYLYWKADILNKAGFDAKVKFRENDKYPQYTLWTNHHPFLTKLYCEMYAFRHTPSKKKKRITRNILKKFTLRTLAVWYMDDGHNKKDANYVHISTDRLNFEEQKLICEWIYNLTGASFKIYRRKDAYYLATYKDAEKFKESIKEYCKDIKCMQYKFSHPISKDRTELTES